MNSLALFTVCKSSTNQNLKGLKRRTILAHTRNYSETRQLKTRKLVATFREEIAYSQDYVKSELNF